MTVVGGPAPTRATRATAVPAPAGFMTRLNANQNLQEVQEEKEVQGKQEIQEARRCREP